jgi:hypothetical protein
MDSKMLKPSVVFLFLFASACMEAPNESGQTTNAAAMIAQSNELNSRCRGGSGDDPRTHQACAARNALGLQLEAQGFCYGENAEFGYQARWDICDRMR